ncbi:hypothetical protein EB796_001440 [Bugula neritina]|uniref:Uncharacterized protein n=1 Tax=Bugula neritina TaxID=10212 RepID=A0A7J7KPW9_BUGNE|nr:hypothetical protein EB796_001440 [Bugula neritina]
MFGHGKPRLRISASALPSTSKNFDVVKLIRETLEDLSYYHPILNKRRVVSRSLRCVTDSWADVEITDDSPPSVAESTTDVVHQEPIELTESVVEEQLQHQSQGDVHGKAIILPAIYNHQGYKLSIRNYHQSNQQSAKLDIKEAGKYLYIRNRLYHSR